MNDSINTPKSKFKIIKSSVPKQSFNIGQQILINDSLFEISAIRPKKLILKLIAQNVKIEIPTNIKEKT